MSLGQVFKSLFWDTLVTAAVKALFTAVPFLGYLGFIIWPVVHYLSDKIFDGMDQFIDLSIIPFKKLEHAREYAKQCIALKAVALTNGVESQEFNDAREAAKIAMRTFVKFNFT